MRGDLLMSKKERHRMRVLERVKMDIISVKEVAPLMGVSYRQAIRIKGRYERGGAGGLVHLSRGRESNRKIDLAIKEPLLLFLRSISISIVFLIIGHLYFFGHR